MPMIDVYAANGTFADPQALAQALATELMTIEQVPDIPMFRKNTAAFVHELPSSHLSNVDGDSTYVRVQVLTNAGALDRDKQLAVVDRLTGIVADAAGDALPALPQLSPPRDGAGGGHAGLHGRLPPAARMRTSASSVAMADRALDDLDGWVRASETKSSVLRSF